MRKLGQIVARLADARPAARYERERSAAV